MTIIDSDKTKMRSNLKSIFAALSFLLLMSACSNPAATIPANSRYDRIGVLPAYEPDTIKRTPPSWTKDALIEHLDLDFGINKLVMDRVKKSMGQTHELVDLQSFSTAYIGTPKVHSSGERKIFGDSRPLFTDVVKAMFGGKRLDAYVVIEGGAVRLYEPQVAPIMQMLKAQGHDLSLQLSIYVIDGRTFQIAAASHASLVQKAIPDSWFVAPRQHFDEIKNALVNLLDNNLEPSLQKLGLTGGQPRLSAEAVQPGAAQ
jgi:hypothetical protein